MNVVIFRLKAMGDKFTTEYIRIYTECGSGSSWGEQTSDYHERKSYSFATRNMIELNLQAESHPFYLIHRIYPYINHRRFVSHSLQSKNNCIHIFRSQR